MSLKIDRRWWVLVAVGMGSFMSALDGSVVNTILPLIREKFNADIASIQWVVTIYLLVLSGFLLTFGRLGDIRGHRTVYIWGFALFIVSSGLCAVAWSTASLVVFRGIQAVGGAMLASNSPAIITGNFPLEQRGRAFGLASTMTYLGLTVGPSLGGWLAQVFGWRTVFFINIPVGILAVSLAFIFIPGDSPRMAAQRFDIPGAVTFFIALTTLLLGLNRGASWGWNSSWVLILITGSLVLFAGFIILEKKAISPMLHLGLFRVPLFSFSVLGAVLNYICIYSIMFLMPFYLIQGRGLDPAQAGLLLTAQPIIMAIAAPVSGALSDRIGSRLPGMLGMAILAVGLFLLSRLSAGTSLGWMILFLSVSGAGTGIFISPNTSALMGSAPRDRQGISSGILAASRNFGMVLGIGLAGAILTTNLARDASTALFRGIDQGFLAASVVALLGMVVSSLKEK